jgi:hypothetical protein
MLQYAKDLLFTNLLLTETGSSEPKNCQRKKASCESRIAIQLLHLWRGKKAKTGKWWKILAGDQ